MSWILAAMGSAFFAGVVSVLAKLGIKTTVGLALLVVGTAAMTAFS